MTTTTHLDIPSNGKVGGKEGKKGGGGALLPTLLSTSDLKIMACVVWSPGRDDRCIPGGADRGSPLCSLNGDTVKKT